MEYLLICLKVSQSTHCLDAQKKKKEKQNLIPKETERASMQMKPDKKIAAFDSIISTFWQHANMTYPPGENSMYVYLVTQVRELKKNERENKKQQQQPQKKAQKTLGRWSANTKQPNNQTKHCWPFAYAIAQKHMETSEPTPTPSTP